MVFPTRLQPVTAIPGGEEADFFEKVGRRVRELREAMRRWKT
jgi:chemotaxis regulatin CheY-phosphate phosphatase CheZ